MKKIIKLTSIVFVLVLIMMLGKVYAVSGNLTMNASKTELKIGDEFTVDIAITNLSSEGVIAFGGTLEYDKDSLSLEKIEGLNGWETPREGRTFHSATGDIAIERDDFGRVDETIIRITFKVKDGAKANSVIMKDVMLADGKTTPLEASRISKSFTIKKGDTIPVVTPTPNSGNNTPATNTPSVKNTNTPAVTVTNTPPTVSTETPLTITTETPANETTSTPITRVTKSPSTANPNEKLPQTGLPNKTVIIAVIAALSVVAIVAFIRIKKINNNNR